MATNTVTHNGIEYFGIAVYKDLNNIIGQTETYPDPDKCLSKDAADKIDTITYTDNDPDGGKLLRYDSIKKKFNTIDVYFTNNRSSSIYIAHVAINFSFYSKLTNTTYTYEIDRNIAHDIISAGGAEKKFTIPNYRLYISRDLVTGLELGKVTISFTLRTDPAARITCYLKNSENTNAMLVNNPYTLAYDHAVNCTLENTSKVVPGPKYEYDTTTLIDYWPGDATFIRFDIH